MSTAEITLTLCIWCQRGYPPNEMQEIPGTDVLLCSTCYQRYEGTEPSAEGDSDG